MPTKILSVDDSKTIRMIVKRAFRNRQCVVCEADNGEEGLVAAGRERPDLILLDITMPVMDGVTMLAKLREDPDLKHIPVIMLTAESGCENVAYIAKLGVRDYLLKPFKDDQLLEKAGRVVPLPALALAAPPPPVPLTMSPPTAVDLAKRYGLEALPESVRRLTQLVARQDANLDELARIISQDKTLVARVLRAANPRAESEQDYGVTTVEAALQHTGVGAALLLAMADPLARAMQKTFVTMLGIDLKILPITAVSPWTGEHVLGEVHFDGKATGTACLHLEPPSAQALATLMLGQSPTDLLEPGEVNDVIGELTNMVVGNFKSNLCDAGLACKLSLPRIRRTAEFSLRTVRGGLSERLAFRAPAIELFVDLCVNPWNG